MPLSTYCVRVGRCKSSKERFSIECLKNKTRCAILSEGSFFSGIFQALTLANDNSLTHPNDTKYLHEIGNKYGKLR